jgi:hypothetical protein
MGGEGSAEEEKRRGKGISIGPSKKYTVNVPN